jgi:hypothetical protein
LDNVTIEDNKIVKNRGPSAIQIQNYGTGLNVNDNKIYELTASQGTNATAYGIQYANSSGNAEDIVIDGNYIYDNNQSQATTNVRGIQFDQNASYTLRNVKITNNFVHIIDDSLTESGLYLTLANTATNLDISNNDFDVPTDGYPIYLSGMSNHAGTLKFHDNVGWGPIYADDDGMAVEDYHCGITFINTGATGTATWELPAAEKGIWFSFVETVAQNMRIEPDGSETINHQTAGVYLELDGQGESVTIKCFNDGEWEIIAGYNSGDAYTFEIP